MAKHKQWSTEDTYMHLSTHYHPDTESTTIMDNTCTEHSTKPRNAKIGSFSPLGIPSAKYSAVFLFFLTLTMCFSANKMDAAPKQLVVATKNIPPFVMQNESGEWEGITVDLVRSIGKKAGAEITFKPMSLPEMLQAVNNGQVDMAAAAIAITPEREQFLDFTHSYYKSGLAIAIKEKNDGWLYLFERILSPSFLKILIGLGVLLLTSGVLIWFFERHHNQENFGGTPAQGIWAGFWWAAVTMTTVGYGDTAPKTAIGRLIGMVWMFSSLILISGFTAAITTVLTVGSLNSGIRNIDDLYGKRVGSVSGSNSSDFLKEVAIKNYDFDSVEDALQALENNELEAVVYDESIMRYLITSGFFHGIKVIDRSFIPEYYALALPSGSPERESINRYLLEIISSKDWEKMKYKYIHHY